VPLQLFTEGNDIGPQQIDRVCETRREPQDLVGERGEDGEEPLRLVVECGKKRRGLCGERAERRARGRTRGGERQRWQQRRECQVEVFGGGEGGEQEWCEGGIGQVCVVSHGFLLLAEGFRIQLQKIRQNRKLEVESGWSAACRVRPLGLEPEPGSYSAKLGQPELNASPLSFQAAEETQAVLAAVAIKVNALRCHWVYFWL